VKHIFFLMITLILSSCTKRETVPAVPDKPAEFFLIHQGTDKYLFRYEYYVIANLPQKISEEDIIKLVENYNRKTITVDIIKSYSVWRFFYRE